VHRARPEQAGMRLLEKVVGALAARMLVAGGRQFGNV
jgi:hypothetical protein